MSPILYTSIDIIARLLACETRLTTATQALSKGGKLAASVRSFKITFPRRTSKPKAMEYWKGKHLKDIVGLLSKCENIRNLHIGYNERSIPYGNGDNPCAGPDKDDVLREAICKTTSLKIITYLQKAVSNYRQCEFDLNVDFFCRLLAHDELESLTLSISESSSVHLINIPTNGNLTSLRLINTYLSEPSLCRVINATPALKTLELRLWHPFFLPEDEHLEGDNHFVDLPIIRQSLRTLNKTLETLIIEFQIHAGDSSVGGPYEATNDASPQSAFGTKNTLGSFKIFEQLEHLELSPRLLLDRTVRRAPPLASLLPASLKTLRFKVDFPKSNFIIIRWLDLETHKAMRCLPRPLAHKVHEMIAANEHPELESVTWVNEDMDDCERWYEEDTLLYGDESKLNKWSMTFRRPGVSGPLAETDHEYWRQHLDRIDA